MSICKKKATVELWREHPKQHPPDWNRCSCPKLTSKWFVKWDRSVAALTALVVFTAILGLVIYNTVENSEVDQRLSTSLDQNLVKERQREGDAIHRCRSDISGNTMTITCSDFGELELDELANQINQMATNDWYTYKLMLSRINFPRGELQANWLQNVEPSISTLFLTNTNIRNVAPYAFSGHPFFDLKYLNLMESGLRTLEKSMFWGTSLETFEFSFYSFTALRYVEENVFDPIKHSLTTLQLERCLALPDILHNITGLRAALLSELLSLTITFNTLGKITDFSFVNVPNVKLVHLFQNSITELEVNALQLPKSEKIYIKDNLLTTLPNNVFSDSGKSTVYIAGNMWRCDCNLEWFRDFYNQSHRFDDPFLCYFQNGTRVDYLEVEFCPSDNTTTTTSTSTTTSATTTTATTTTTEITTTPTTTVKPESNLVQLECTEVQIISDQYRRTAIYQTSVRNNSVHFTFRQIDDEPKYDVSIVGDVLGEFLIWINSKNTSDYGCQGNISARTSITGLRHEDTYTVCLLKADESTISPYDCTGLWVPPEWGARTWIPNRTKVPLVVGICIALLVTVLTTGLAVFYFIRQHPKLIQGNPRVIIVESQAADAIVLPKTYDRPDYAPPSLVSASDGYLTPRHKVYERPPLRTICEGENAGSAYPFTRRIHRSQVKHRAKLDEVTRSFDEHLYEPPPLPPNHPSEWRSRMVHYSHV